MTATKLCLAVLTAWLTLSGCTSNVPKSNGESQDLYSKHGMEVSKVASEMADSLVKTLKQDLSKEKSGGSEYPTIGVTSFVDTDTYENAGYLGRALGEFFIHELDRRGIPVSEFKLTGNISVSKDGEDVFSRDWKKLAGKARFRHILAGTITRNEQGVVLLSRIIDMQSAEVKGSATGFIPYKDLPYCYRTADKNCSFEGIVSYSTYIPSANNVKTVSTDGSVKDTVTSVRVTSVSASSSAYTAAAGKKTNGNVKEDVRDRKAREKLEHDPDFNDKYYPLGASVPATSTGNYEQFIHDNGSMSGHGSVIYPADTYRVSGHLVRDVHDQSQYQRIADN